MSAEAIAMLATNTPTTIFFWHGNQQPSSAENTSFAMVIELSVSTSYRTHSDGSLATIREQKHKEVFQHHPLVITGSTRHNYPLW